MADLSNAVVSPAHTAAPAATLAKSFTDPPTNSKAIAWIGDRGILPPSRIAGWGLTATPTPTYHAY